MALLILSFIAGVLTIAAPCVLPLLPVIVGGSLVDDDTGQKSQKYLKPIVVTASLAVSVIVFTLILKASTALLGVPTMVWQTLSGVIVLALGIQMLFPKLWESISIKFNLLGKSHVALGKAEHKGGLGGSVLMGVALGPVFSSCSPTYAFIVAAVIPVSFLQGFTYLVAYALGLSIALLLVAFLGRALVDKLGWLSNPNGWFKRTIGVLFILVGIFVIFGLDKDIQSYVLEKGWYNPISNLEENLKN
jgi:cytochrome c-type biogenesis protein